MNDVVDGTRREASAVTRLRDVLRFAVWLWPASRAKNALLRALGHRIHPRAVVASNVVWRVREFEMGDRARVGRGNFFKNMRGVRLGDDALIDRMNLVSSHPLFVSHIIGGGTLRLDAHAKITSRHQLDCSGSVRLGRFASLAGQQSRILSHSIDVTRNAQSASPVIVGERSFLGTRVLILGGASLPARSVLGAGSVLTRNRGTREPGLWAGVPATYHGAVSGAWFEREETSTHDLWIPGTGEIVRAG